MNSARLRVFGSTIMILGLLMMLGLSLRLAAPANAQSTCNGVPATIVGASPGLITGTEGNDVIVGTSGADQIFGLGCRRM